MSFKVIARGLETDVGLKLSQLIEDLPYVLVDASLSVGDDWVFFLEQEKPGLVLNVVRPANIQEAEYELQVQAAMVSALRNYSAPLIQLSSFRAYGEDYIVDSPDERAFPSPVDELGKALVELEQCAAKIDKHINLRLSWLLDGKGSLLERLVPLILSGDPLVASDHKFGRPLSALCVAKVLVALIQQVLSGAENWGNFHIHSSDLCSEAEFCDHLCRSLSAELDMDLPMPEVASKGDERSIFKGSGNLQGRRITDDFGIQSTSWRSSFRKLLNTWLCANGVIESEDVG